MLRRADAAYEGTRQRMLWNQRVPDRFPDVIASPRSAGEIVETLNAARSEGLQVAIRSGGHSWHASGLRQGGLLLDLGAFDEVSIDPRAGTATVGPAVQGRNFLAALGGHGLAFPAGHCPTVAMGGYLLAGGRGWNWAEWGSASASVEAIDVITADGVEHRASADENPDLLWAARGSGPAFFAVVTRFHVRAHPMPPSIAAGSDVYPLDLVDDVMDWVSTVRRSWLGETRVSLVWLQDSVDVPQPVIAVATTAFGQSPEETARILKDLDECPVRGRALASNRDWQTSIPELYVRRDKTYPDDRRWAADTFFSTLSPTACVSMLAEDLVRAPSRDSSMLVAPLRGPIPPFPPPGAVLSQDGDLNVYVYGTWDNATDDAANLAWVDETARKHASSIEGHYVGEVDLTRWPVEDCFSAENWRRLEALRDRYDPDRLFFRPFRPAA
jgi:FAD/FMN-containing dehydrogenase